MNIGIILAGGKGIRFGSSVPKQFHKLNGKEIIAYSIEALKNSTQLDYFYVVGNSQNENQRLHSQYEVDCLLGGESRNESIKCAIDYIEKHHPECENIFIHEAVRPLITSDIVDEYIEKLDQYEAVITTQHITDSLGSNLEWYVNREDYYLVQAPEAFKFNILRKYFRFDSPITATVQQLPANIKVYKNFDFKNNYKVTYKQDLAVVEQIIQVGGKL